MIRGVSQCINNQTFSLGDETQKIVEGVFDNRPVVSK